MGWSDCNKLCCQVILLRHESIKSNVSRAAGIVRFDNAVTAVQKCPGIKLVHVQTWREGDTISRYHEEPTVVDHKVSLDPYRRESRRILEIFKKHCGHVEKASIDESFLDLSTIVKERLLQRHGHLLDLEHAGWDDPLPEAPSVHWTNDVGVLIDLDTDHTEEDRNDWDDVIMHIAAEVMTTVREDVKNTLGYTCSAGIARNKTLAKLAAGQNKPAKQTILRNRSVQSFINGIPFTKIRNLGGKLGVEVEKIFETSSAKDITSISIEDLRKKLGTETGQWLYNIVRGIDYSEVSTNTQVKSMLSAKSFRPQIDSIAQAERWIKVLTADLASRLLEDPNQRRPKTLTMHHRVPGASKTRQAPIPRGPELDNNYLASLSMKLLMQINTEGRAFPCFNLSLGLSGFEGLEAGVQDIGGFFKMSNKRIADTNLSDFVDQKKLVDEDWADHLPGMRQKRGRSDSLIDEEPVEALTDIVQAASIPQLQSIESSGDDGSFRCDRCHKPIIGETHDEHQDWHFAKDLARDLARSEQADRLQSASAKPKEQHKKNTLQTTAKKSTKSKVLSEKGQKKLKF